MPAGGRDQFNWDNVKADKEREYYLGHSVKALTGRWAGGRAGAPPTSRLCALSLRCAAPPSHLSAPLPPTHPPTRLPATPLRAPHRWQKGRDVYWYTRDVERSEADKQAELAMVKQREQDLMMEVRVRRRRRETRRRKAGASPAGTLARGELLLSAAVCWCPQVFDKRQRCLPLHRTAPSPLPHATLQALGMKPKAPKQLKQAQLDKADMQRLLQGTGGWRGATPGHCLPSCAVSQLCTVASCPPPPQQHAAVGRAVPRCTQARSRMRWARQARQLRRRWPRLTALRGWASTPA